MCRVTADLTAISFGTRDALACLTRARAGYSGSMNHGFRLIGCVALAIAFAGVVPADELKLKDGSTVVGTIVGFEQNSFKVKTSYGYAVVLKDQVASITISDSPKTADAAAASSYASATPAAKPAKPD